jgi:hypothetical protein
MYLLVEDAVVLCDHQLGKVDLAITQQFVRINHRRILVEKNPEGRVIGGCPNYGPTIKPCTQTLPVKEGYSDLLRIEGKRVCLDTVTGLTDGTPPGTVNYRVKQPGQQWVNQINE